MSARAQLNAWKTHAGRWPSISVALGVTAGLLLIVQAWLLARCIDAVIFHGAGLAAVRPWLWQLLALFVLRAFFVWLAERAAFRSAIQVKQYLRDHLLRHLQALGPVNLGRERAGELASLLADGVEALEAYYARYLPAISLMALVPLAILAFVLPLDWIGGLILLGTAPLIPLFMILIGKGAERLNQQQWRVLGLLSARFLDAVQGFATLKLFNAAGREARILNRLSD